MREEIPLSGNGEGDMCVSITVELVGKFGFGRIFQSRRNWIESWLTTSTGTILSEYMGAFGMSLPSDYQGELSRKYCTRNG